MACGGTAPDSAIARMETMCGGEARNGNRRRGWKRQSAARKKWEVGALFEPEQDQMPRLYPTDRHRAPQIP
ncbi:hypothetical protein LINPERPRIM_LOCUS20679, partial [Linum perenne]